jgi:RHS repeat-associated protein
LFHQKQGTWVKLGSEKIVEYSDGKTYFYHNDHLGSPTVVTDHAGTTQLTRRQFPCGEVWQETGPKFERHRLTGKEVDFDLGFHYFGARYYHAWYSRRTSVDPVMGDPTNPQRLNRYAYVLNDPVN